MNFTFLNCTFLVFGSLSILLSQLNSRSVDALVRTDATTLARIHQLEMKVRHDAADNSLETEVELAQRYAMVGEYPWALEIVSELEQRMPKTQEILAELGAAYLQIGSEPDALRVFSEFESLCLEQKCVMPLTIKVSIFRRAALLLQDRGINSRLHPEAANRILRELLKPTAMERGRMP